MKKYALALLLTLLAATANASGLYYDADRNGEGILILDNETTIVGYLFTYGGEACNDVRLPQVGPHLPTDTGCKLNEQRWFFFADDLVNGEASGTLYIASGVNYPDGEIDPDNPFGVIVGLPEPVGTYHLRTMESGYQVIVLSEGTTDDPLYERIFNFTAKLFP